MPLHETTYAHGYHDSVLRSHATRTAHNSAGYLLKHLTPTMRILDVGCGPGTITASLASLVPEGHVTGIDCDAGVLERARAHAAQAGITNITFAQADVSDLRAVDTQDGYDVVHCHQVLQHVCDPVRALREMARATRAGGIVAAREADARGFVWFPEGGLGAWMAAYGAVARASGAEPEAGRRLVAWAREAGFARARVAASVGASCWSAPEERAAFAAMWAERVVESAWAACAVEKGIADRAVLEGMARDWRAWGESEDGWFAMLQGEIVCRVE